jgi:hypothetical protein
LIVPPLDRVRVEFPNVVEAGGGMVDIQPTLTTRNIRLGDGNRVA